MSSTFVPSSPATLPAEPLATRLAESGLLPDTLLRAAMRRLCTQRLREERTGGADAAWERQRRFVASLRESAIAIETDAANRQHYEVPPRFFELCLGKRLKYSSCYWDASTADLDAAEERMLHLYAERAQLHDGQRILELGCGWGSLTLWMAEQYPGARITAVSNSRPQREHILAQCHARGLDNVKVITHDANTLTLPAASYDRVVSIEMFEHMRNYRELLARISNWLVPDGQLFVHIFCHRDLAYPFEVQGEDNWMGRHFFTGGLMPAADTLLQFQDDLTLDQRWLLSGQHYEKTANAWLHNQDRHREELMPVLEATYGDDAKIWWQRWRMFWMACAELFGYEQGQQWGVAHYRFVRR